MTISEKSFVHLDPSSIPLDTEYVRCNFMRRQPDMSGPQPVGVRLFPGDDTPRTFRRCNMINCEPPPGSTLIQCNTKLIEKDVPTVQDRIIVDGTTVHTRQRTLTRLHGQWNPQSESYQYLGTPIETDDD